ncbi:MAG TPA: hypothetical protein IAA26_00790 [Candidatus Blautia faecipullorum]|nr:hypothetical protein [Candidatus Blautia faecipullorum]
MENTIKGILGGAWFGIIGSPFLAIVACSTGIELGMRSSLVFAVCIGAIIGGGIGYLEDLEIKKKRVIAKENERKAKLNARFLTWQKNLLDHFGAITKKVYTCSGDFSTADMYAPIWELEKVQTEERHRYEKAFSEALTNHINELRRFIDNNISRPGYYGVRLVLNALKCLREAYKGEERFNKAVDILTELCENIDKQTYCINYQQYGDCTLKVTEDGYQIKERLCELEKKLVSIGISISNAGDFYEYLSSDLPNWTNYAAEVMWCRACEKPFDREKFDTAGVLFGCYINKHIINGSKVIYTTVLKVQADGKDKVVFIEGVHVERILALVYANNLVGGKSLVNQQKKLILEWVDNAIFLKNEQGAFLLASGLAWMGFFELERDVLRRLFEKKVSFEMEYQDRLNFLECGGSTNIKIYDIEKMDGFLFDSSSIEWNVDAFDLFFRKLEMAHKNLEYSLAIAKWTKTLPLSSGQRISQEQIEYAFAELVKDFDGEVVMKKEDARALNLVNVHYKDSYIFNFRSERNRCVSMLFSSEKYGRNLNLTIITMFTPEKGIEIAQLKKYALAIKDNIYVQSFKESILQVIDEVTKERQVIYDEGGIQGKVIS